MAQLNHSTSFTSAGTTSVNVTIPAVAVGATLICVSHGGVVVQAAAGGRAFTKRTTSLSGQEVACQDLAAAGGETSVALTFNGTDNISGVILEFAGTLTFAAGAKQAGSLGSLDQDLQATAGSLTVTSPSLLLVAHTSADADATPSRQWWGVEPLGSVVSNGHNGGAGATKYWAQVGLADVAPGTYTCKSSRIIGSYQAACWAYTDTSGVASHAPYANPIVAENTLPGSKFSTWFGATTSATIAGYTDGIAYAPGDTVAFKVDSGNAPFTVEVFRAGYYGYLLFGAKRKATITGTPTTQPAATVDELGGTVCAWSTTATWTIPTDATPGVYLANFRRTDATGGVAGTVFVVRSAVPASRTDQVMVKTSEFTWQAYNLWGGTGQVGAGNAPYTGRSLYGQGGAASLNIAQRAFGVSFDRPFSTGASNGTGYFFDAEYALIAFLEGNGYDLGYYSSTDIDRDPTIPAKYRIAVTSAHDEYWTENLHTAFEQARDAGTNLVSFSSNTALWRVRFDPADTTRRRMICYKNSHDTPGFDGVTRYDPITYTGTWRDTRTTPGGVNNTDRRPESALFGQWFIGNGPQQRTIVVPDTAKTLPIWRNTPVTTLAPGTSQTLFTNSLGFEFDYINPAPIADTPANLVRLQTQSITLNGQAADDNGATYNGDGTFLYGMSLYRADSGALVYGAGTWRWAAGLNRIRYGGADTNGTIDLVMQQATLNLLADLGITPAGLMTTTANGTTTALVDPSPAANPADYGLTVDTGIWGIPIA